MKLLNASSILRLLVACGKTHDAERKAMPFCWTTFCGVGDGAVGTLCVDIGRHLGGGKGGRTPGW